MRGRWRLVVVFSCNELLQRRYFQMLGLPMWDFLDLRTWLHVRNGLYDVDLEHVVLYFTVLATTRALYGFFKQSTLAKFD